MDDEKLRALPRDVPDYHIRQAAHLRALAENAPTSRVKARLLRDADEHEPARWSGQRASLSNPPNRQDRLPARIAPAAAEQRFYIARSISFARAVFEHTRGQQLNVTATGASTLTKSPGPRSVIRAA